LKDWITRWIICENLSLSFCEGIGLTGIIEMLKPEAKDILFSRNTLRRNIDNYYTEEKRKFIEHLKVSFF
jgi:hypothetical protein